VPPLSDRSIGEIEVDNCFVKISRPNYGGSTLVDTSDVMQFPPRVCCRRERYDTIRNRGIMNDVIVRNLSYKSYNDKRTDSGPTMPNHDQYFEILSRKDKFISEKVYN